jgi:hypothetical protein
MPRRASCTSFSLICIPSNVPVAPFQPARKFPADRALAYIPLSSFPVYGPSGANQGVVILSPSFFSKHWPQAELDGLVAREAHGDKRILPVWHKLSFEEVCKHSPLLAGKVAAQTKDGLRVVADSIIKSAHRTMKRRANAPIFNGRITRKILMSLPEGAYLYSNCFSGDHVLVFAKELGRTRSS